MLAPRKPPRLPLIDVASRYIPAQAGVSGDFYQVAAGRNGAAIVVIGDAVGKGMDAARRSTFVRANVAACAPYADDPAAIIRTVNAELVHQYGGSAQFITMLCVVVHADATHELGVRRPSAAGLAGRRRADRPAPHGAPARHRP